jgi:glycosyltransferase involved in cell wall biosynthesis
MNSISVIIPCYNEWSRVWELVRHILSIFENQIEIIISDQSSTDEIFMSCKMYLNTSVLWKKSPGTCRAQTMNYWASFATGDLYVFLHADTQLPLQAKNELERLELNTYLGGWFLKLYGPFTFWTSVMTIVWNQRRKKTKQFFWDNAIFCSKEIFEKLWWYANMKLFEDVDFSKRLFDFALQEKKDIFVCLYPVITSARKYIQQGFWKVLFLQMKLQLKYKLGLFDGVSFAREYWKI